MMNPKYRIIATIFIPMIYLAGCATKPTGIPQLSMMDVPCLSPSSEPFLFTGDNDKVYLSWIETHGEQAELRFSLLDGNIWSQPQLIDSGQNWFVNWADFPMMAANRRSLIASYLAKSGPGKFSYDIRLTTSSDDGQTWSSPIPLNEDAKEAEHGFTSFLSIEDKYFASWLDGRNTVMEDADHHGGDHGAMSLRGAYLESNGHKVKEWELDNRTCDCCQTCSALTNNGPIVVYRDRSETEVRDIAIVRLLNGKWTKPRTIYNDGWVIAGCPVNGPRADARGNKLAIAWFSAPDNKPEVKVSFSNDGGESFGTPIRVDHGKAVGRVDLVMMEDGSIFVSWMEATEIMVAKVNEKGVEWSTPVHASTSARSTGFPQLTRSQNRLIFAWTDDEEKVVKCGFMPLPLAREWVTE